MRLCVLCAVLVAVSTSTIAAPTMSEGFGFTRDFRVPHQGLTPPKGAQSSTPVERSNTSPTRDIHSSLKANPPPTSQQLNDSPPPFHNENSTPRGPRSNNADRYQASRSSSSPKSKLFNQATQWLKNWFLKMWDQFLKKLQECREASVRRRKQGRPPGRGEPATRDFSPSWAAGAQDHFQSHQKNNEGLTQSHPDAPEHKGESLTLKMLTPKRDPHSLLWLHQVTTGVASKFIYSLVNYGPHQVIRLGVFGYISRLFRSVFKRAQTIHPHEPLSPTSTKSSEDGTLSSPQATTQHTDLPHPSVGYPLPQHNKLQRAQSFIPITNRNQMLHPLTRSESVPNNLYIPHPKVETLQSFRDQVSEPKQPNFVPTTKEGEVVAILLNLVDTSKIADIFRSSLMEGDMKLKLIAKITTIPTLERLLGRILQKAGAWGENQLTRLNLTPESLEYVKGFCRMFSDVVPRGATSSSN